jgi:hypothetical protein
MGKKLLKFQSTMQPPPKGKGVPMHVTKANGELEVLLHSFRTSIPEELCGHCYALTSVTLGKDPPAPTEDGVRCVPHQKAGKTELWPLSHAAHDLITVEYAYIIRVKVIQEYDSLYHEHGSSKLFQSTGNYLPTGPLKKL